MEHISDVMRAIGAIDPSASDPYAHVQLSEEEAQLALRAARQLKGMRLDHEEKVRRSIALEKEMRRPWSASELADHVRNSIATRLGISFVVDDYNRDVLNLLCYYFSNDARFEMSGHSLGKGIALCGPPGTGKTFLMEAFSRNKRASFDIVRADKLADWYIDNPHIVNNFSETRKQPNHDPHWFYQAEVGLYLDDIGVEEEKSSYGNKANVIGKILTNRHANKEVPFWMTHISTNLMPEDIEAAYGPRLRSRFREMFNLITVVGPDRRK